ncbi:hypothetical protein TRICI_004179 [Trichomonascus ciferrii]|uniref:Calcineurin-like phosphoesterase domain-containing protein n=1 Tax=Trichomonascus ciferrii TaxID=44093 RepID=A0A642V156_9ASCO|nr:hypothetical protein TRICI_004179 [Trichomonascus ciferrii]
MISPRRAVRVLLTVLGLITLGLNLYIYNYDRLDVANCRFGPESDIRLLAFGDPQIRGSDQNTPLRTRLDIFGNDYFLGHIYRLLTKRLDPTHVAVMGDLFSSQWIGDQEFHHRAKRYKERIFTHWDSPHPVFINVSGNHDIGYAGEMTTPRVRRFRHEFGELNYVREYDNWRFVVLNTLALDGPAVDDKFPKETAEFLDELKDSQFVGPTVLITHVPLHKPAGICRDGPSFTYYTDYPENWLRSQNHLSYEATQRVLNSVFTPGNPYGGVMLAGHDHEGCKATYFYDGSEWKAYPYQSVSSSVQEYTVKSMMGEYGGNAALLSGVFDKTAMTWSFKYSLCPFAVQHVWWVTKVVTIITIALTLSYGLLHIITAPPRPHTPPIKKD